jgi:hypothetical protein
VLAEALLTRIVREPDPVPPIVEHLMEMLDPLVDLDDLASSYARLEEELQAFERWLHDSWGTGFYRRLVSTPEQWALTYAFTAANPKKGNILICDGFSIREILVLKKAFGEQLTYTVGRSPAPTTTGSTARQFFQVNNLKDVFAGERLI